MRTASLPFFGLEPCLAVGDRGNLRGLSFLHTQPFLRPPRDLVA